MRRTALPILGITALVLLLILARELLGDASDAGVTSQAPARAVAAAVQASARTLPDLTTGWTQTLLARPLFDPDRRPAASEAQGGANPASSGLPRLAGIAVGPGSRTAIFMPSENAKPIVATVGTRLGAYVIRAVEPGAVTIEGPQGLRILRPMYANGTAAASQVDLLNAPVPVVNLRHAAEQREGREGGRSRAALRRETR